MGRGYIPVEVDRHVRTAARNRCGYCLSPQHLVMARLEIEHLIPESKGGGRDESNLWLSCPLCNRHKADRILVPDTLSAQTVPLFNPRTQNWCEHFACTPVGLRI